MDSGGWSEVGPGQIVHTHSQVWEVNKKYCQNDGFNDSNAMSASKVVYLANL